MNHGQYVSSPPKGGEARQHGRAVRLRQADLRARVGGDGGDDATRVIAEAERPETPDGAPSPSAEHGKSGAATPGRQQGVAHADLATLFPLS